MEARKNMKIRGLAIAALAVCVGMMATVAHAEMKAGEWELTVKMKMPGVPIPMPPIKVKQCMNPDQPIPAVGSPDQECKVKDHKTEGDKVTWTVECKQPDGSSMTGSGEMTFKDTTMTGSQKITGSALGPNGTMEYSFSGKWLGPCTE